MNRGLLVLLAAVCGGLVVGLVMWLAEPTATAPKAAAVKPAIPATVLPSSSTAADAAMAGKQAAPTHQQLPPWARNLRSTPSATPLPASAAMSAKQHQLAAVQARLQELMRRGNPSVAEVDDVLADLIRVQGNTVIGGVDLAALRNKLAAVTELQRIAGQLKAETQKPDGGDKHRIKQLTDQLKALQPRLRGSVLATGPAPAGSR